MIWVYLFAIVAANLLTARFGPGMSVVNAFVFIGFDLTSRDRLHEKWQGNGLIWKMGLLILAGSFISWVLNRDAGRVALASFLAFGIAAVVDTFIYQILHNQKYLIKVNTSNVFSSMADSLIFPTVAFGGFMPLITLGQFAVKVLGGFAWAFILRKK
jgi:hypothetical protein